ncbi:MAG: bifunctional [glutamine synthetase] adenylyltransferase/[glutamine synthetase]-adenylyl-L-tyrosine phosphorylase [Acidimicrobiales bacterium]
MAQPQATLVDEVIERSAAPAPVRLAIERMTDTHRDLRERLACDHDLLAAVVAVTAASRSLARLLETDAAAIDVLAGLDERPTLDDDVDAAGLVRWQRLEFARVATRDHLGLDDLEATGAALAAIASDVFDVACRLTGAADLAVIGMGKLGGGELNYASDVDVVFVGGADDRMARAVTDIARRCFRVDLNLRPEGRDGALVRSIASFEAYWERWAQPWEFQALLKARAVASDRELGDAFARAAGEHLWARRFSADDLRAIRAMKVRAEHEIARKGLAQREVKRGRGGIRDVEFAVQLLQLVHGPLDPALRSPTTLVALGELADAGYVGRSDADQLSDAYRFLRTVEHRLQLVEEQQIHAVPVGEEARDHLGRILGYRSTPLASVVDQLEADLGRHQATVRGIHERIWFRPLLEAFSAAGPNLLTPEAAATRLAAFGFTDVGRTRQAVTELTRGLTRSSRLMQQLLPLLLDWLSESPDPDMGLLGLRHLASGSQRSTALATAFRESPEVARRLSLLLGTGRQLGRLFAHNPDLVPLLARPAELALRSRKDLVEAAHAASDWRDGRDERRAALRRLADRELLRIATHDVLRLAGVPEVGAALSALAEAVLQAAGSALRPALPFAVVAMGRFGGAELSYASDLDVIFVYDGSTPSDFETAEALATDVMRFVGGGTPKIYDMDAGLRPEGKQGPLARSVEAYRVYFERWAQPWERLAMTRARPVAGDLELGRRLIAELRPLVWRDGLSDDDRREIRRIKARVERERIPPNEDPQFHLKLGRGSLSDVEFTAQLLQLQHGIESPGTMAALDRLAAAGVLERRDHASLAAAYRFCERARNRLFLLTDAPSDSLPQQSERLARLARSLDLTPRELRDDYRRRTRRARAVVERLFYGRD